MNIKSNGALLTVLLIIFVDVLGFTIMIPLLPFYAQSLGATPFVVGMLSSIYGICSLISGPILGDLSDRYGRKKILFISQIGTCLGFIIMALSKVLWIVFLARIIDGVTAGNLTVAQAYISDVTKYEERTEAMALIGASFGLGFVLGPLISGVLVQFGHAAPIWASAFLSFVSIIGTIFFLEDSIIHNHKTNFQSIFDQIKKYYSFFKTPVLKDYFYLFFIFSISFQLYISGLALYCERKVIWDNHAFTAKEVGFLFSFLGVISLAIQTLLIGPLVKKFGEIKIILFSFLSTALAFAFIAYTQALFIFLIGITFNNIAGTLLRPSILGSISKNSSPAKQGLVFGVNQTLMSIAQIICPLISGILIEKNWSIYWCLLISGISLLGFILAKLSSTQMSEPA